MSKKKVKKKKPSDKKAFTFSITVFAKTEEEAIAKFTSEEIHPADMNIYEQSKEAHEYVNNENDAAGCPNCGSGENLDSGDLETSGNQAWRSYTCLDCGCEFDDIYTLTDVEVKNG